jgi:hypothetical protein
MGVDVISTDILADSLAEVSVMKITRHANHVAFLALLQPNPNALEVTVMVERAAAQLLHSVQTEELCVFFGLLPAETIQAVPDTE